MTAKITDILDKAKETHLNRSKEYGHGYDKIGKVLLSFFPDGIHLKTESDMSKFSTLLMCITKIHRYAESLSAGCGGHVDSAHDLINYAAILEYKTGNDNEIYK